MPESEYPYTSHDWDSKTDAPTTDCKYEASKATSVRVTNITYASHYLDGFKKALQKQPLIIAVAANNIYIHSYASGVIDASDCTTTVMFED